MNKLAVSLVEFNTRELLKSTLQGLLQQKDVDLEIWVVDNASSDGSAQMVASDFPQVKLIANQDNVGFAAAHNQILRQVKTDYVLLLNPDTSLADDAISKMVKFMEDHISCGIASCKIVGRDGSLHSNGGDLPFGLSLISWLFNLEMLGSFPNFHRRDQAYYTRARIVGWVGGTLMMIRAKMLAKTGLLSEDYFMYFEDVDFCFKARKAGWQVMINPQVVAEHLSGASSSDPKLAQWGGEFRGLLLFYRKQFGYWAAVLLKLLIYLTVGARMIAFAILGKFNYSRTYAKILVTI